MCGVSVGNSIMTTRTARGQAYLRLTTCAVVPNPPPGHIRRAAQHAAVARAARLGMQVRGLYAHVQTHRERRGELRGTPAQQHAELAAAHRARLRVAHCERAPRAEARHGPRELRHSGNRASNLGWMCEVSARNSIMTTRTARKQTYLRLTTCAVVSNPPPGHTRRAAQHAAAARAARLGTQMGHARRPRAQPGGHLRPPHAYLATWSRLVRCRALQVVRADARAPGCATGGASLRKSADDLGLKDGGASEG